MPPEDNYKWAFNTLGRPGATGFQGLETIDVLANTKLKEVTFESDEVTAICPVTSQPDQYTVGIYIRVGRFSLESKSLKLYLQQFRNQGIFCEALADTICKDIVQACFPLRCIVTIEQKSRGGITLTSVAEHES